MDYSVVRHSSKVNSSIVSRSMISEINRTMSKEETFHRKLKILLEKNNNLQKKIKDHENQIKDERTVIIYQMNELTKAVGLKISTFQDLPLTYQMFENQTVAHENLKDLMQKFEEIQKEELMMRKIKDNLDNIYMCYRKHKQDLERTNSDFQLMHEELVEGMKNQIQEKKGSQIEKTEEQHQQYLIKIAALRDEMEVFKDEQDDLKEEQIFLRKEIEKYEEEIKEKSKKYKEMSEITEIVIDKKNRYKVYEKIGKQKKILEELTKRNRKKEIELNEWKIQQMR